MRQKRYVGAVVYGVLLASFTLYTLLDTFVIPRTYAQVPSPTPAVQAEAAETAEAEPAAEAVITGNTYSDGRIHIEITQYRQYDTTIYAADVQVSDPQCLKTALAQNAYGRNITQTTSQMAQDNGAILAVNGDYYGAQTKGYVIRNGVLYRDSPVSGREDLVIWADGSFSIAGEGEVSAQQLLQDGAQQVLSFGPALVVDGAVAIGQDEEVGKAMASNPRTAIGILEPGHYLFVVSDGRTQDSAGLSLYQLAQCMAELGADIAYNLDGGGSSTMVFNGTVLNNPTTSGRSIKERSVSDIVYIG